jgi:hypothetical protein
MNNIDQTSETTSTTPTRPQPDMGDLEAIRECLDDPNFVWEL